MVNFTEDYKLRVADGANVAERECIKYLNKKDDIYYTKFGFDEVKSNVPSKWFFKIPSTLRSCPDYLIIKDTTSFLEAKGYRDCLKVKEHDIQGYKFWDSIVPLYFFLYNCDVCEYDVIPFSRLLELIKDAETGTYPDNNKLYYKVIIRS